MFPLAKEKKREIKRKVKKENNDSSNALNISTQKYSFNVNKF